MLHLDDHTAAVQEQLSAAASLGDQHTRDVAAALGTALVPALRLAITSAVSAAADEITSALLDHPGSPAVTAQLDGADLRLEVRSTDYANYSDTGPAPSAEEGDASARISLRLPEALKAEIESAARNEGVSVNTWLVRAATRSLRMAGPAAAAAASVHEAVNEALRRANNAHKLTGWING
jgi:hypothetical protein